MTQSDDLVSSIGRPPERGRAWAETAAVTVLVVALLWTLGDADPFSEHGGFAWLAVAPLLSGLRFGVSCGVSSASALVVLLGGLWSTGAYFRAGFPGGQCLGILTLGVLGGEFCNAWMRTGERLRAAADYRRRRLEEFTRTFHVLKLSHDRLEHRLMGNAQSLRGCLLGMRSRLMQADLGPRPLLDVGDRVLELFSNYCWVQIGSLFEVDEDGVVYHPAVAFLGKDCAIPPDDPMLVEALQTKQLVCVHPDRFVERGRDEMRSRLLAAVPLVDVDGRVWGVVAVREMSFLAFHEDNLRVLAVLAGHIGDAFLLGDGIHDESSAEEREFRLDLRRSLHDLQEHGLPSAAIGMSFREPALAEAIVRLVGKRRRGLDRLFVLRDACGHPTAFLLLPHTDEVGMRGYLRRLERLVQERFGLSTQDAGLIVSTRLLSPQDTSSRVLGVLKRRCRIDDRALDAVAGDHVDTQLDRAGGETLDHARDDAEGAMETHDIETPTDAVDCVAQR